MHLGPGSFTCAWSQNLGSTATLTIGVPDRVPRESPSARTTSSSSLVKKKEENPNSIHLWGPQEPWMSCHTWDLHSHGHRRCLWSFLTFISTNGASWRLWCCALLRTRNAALHPIQPVPSQPATFRWKSFPTQASVKRLKELMVPQMCRHKCKAIRNMISENLLLSSLSCFFFFFGLF